MHHCDVVGTVVIALPWFISSDLYAFFLTVRAKMANGLAREKCVTVNVPF